MFITEVVGCKCDVLLASLVWDRDVKVCLCISGNDTRRTSQISWVKMQSQQGFTQVAWVSHNEISQIKPSLEPTKGGLNSESVVITRLKWQWNKIQNVVWTASQL